MKIRSLTLIALLLALLTAAGCAKTPEQEDEPRVTPVPEAEYTVSHVVRYWPEDADYDTCDYACVAQVPEFSLSHSCGYRMNAEVEAYLESLERRIETLYIPNSEAKPPYTEVAFEVVRTGDITNIIFREKHSWGVVPYTESHVVMLDENGGRISLNDVFMTYHAGERIAEVIAERLEKDPRFAAKTKEELLPLIDLREGGYAIENGARVYIKRGGIAPVEEGELAFEVSFEEAHPELEAADISWDEYRGLVRLLRAASEAIVVRMESFENGEMSVYTAMGFMARAVRELKLVPEAGRICVPQKDFEALYTACTGAQFPGIDEAEHDIELEDGVYSVKNTLPPYEYNVDIISLTREGENVLIDGDLIYGAFGFRASEFNCHIRLTLRESGKSPYGFEVRSLELYN